MGFNVGLCHRVNAIIMIVDRVDAM